ncbi:MAG: glycosyltransferase [Pseudomonadota bacterium]
MQAIGLIRFSYFTDGGYQIAHKNDAETLAYLYSDARLTQRFAFFEHVCLPSIRAQTDPDFTVALVTSTNMPAPWRARLEALVDGVDQIKLLYLPRMNQRDMSVTVAEMFKVGATDDDWVAHFRLDDDDAIGRSFIADTRRRARRICRLADMDRRVGLDYDCGFVVSPRADGMHAAQVFKRNWTPAQIVFLRQKDFRTIMHFPHHILDQKMPVVTIPRPPMFIRSVNDFNDSGTTDFRRPIPPMTAELAQTVRDKFDVDLYALQEAAQDFI